MYDTNVQLTHKVIQLIIAVGCDFSQLILINVLDSLSNTSQYIFDRCNMTGLQVAVRNQVLSCFTVIHPNLDCDF